MSKHLIPTCLVLLVLSGPAVAAGTAAVPGANATSSQPSPDVINGLFQQAIAATQAGQATKAEALYARLLKLAPKVAPAWANLGLLKATQGHLDEAATDMQKAVALEPKTAPFWAQLASIEIRRGRPGPAAVAARKTLALDPANEIGLANLCGALLQQGRYAEAIDPLKRLDAANQGKNAQATFDLAVTLQRVKRPTDAIVVAKRLVARFPDVANYQLMLGDMAAQSADYATAQQAYSRVYALVPSDTRAGVNAAIAAEMGKHPDVAKSLIQRIVAAHPDDALAHFQLGRLYYLYPALADRRTDPLANFKDAAESFRQAMLLDPKNPLYVSNLALALMFQGQPHFAEARQLFHVALNLAPKLTVAHMGLGYLAEQQHAPADAITEYRAILAYAPDLYDPRRRLAGLLYATGQRDSAYVEFRSLAARTPGARGGVPLEELASLLMRDRRYAEARDAYQQAAQRDPGDGAALVGLGQALEFLKQPEAAERAYASAVAVAPQNTTVYAAFGNLLQSEHKIAAATKLYERFVAADPTNNDAHWQLAQLYEAQKRDDDAVREMHRLTLRRSDPTHVAYLLGPAQLLMDRGRYLEAVTELQRAIAENPTDRQELEMVLAVAEEKAGKGDHAEKTLNGLLQTVKLPKDRTRVNLTLGDYYESKTRWEDAAQKYEDVLREDAGQAAARDGLFRARTALKQPDAATAFLEGLALADGTTGPNLPAAMSAAALYQQQGNAADRYVVFAKRVMERYPKDRGALNFYAEALLRAPAGSAVDKDRRAAALDVYRQMIALNGKDGDAYYRLAQQQEALGQRDSAIASYRSALASAGADATSAAVAQSARLALTRLGIVEPPVTAQAPTAGRDNGASTATAPSIPLTVPSSPATGATAPAPTAPMVPLKSGN